MSSYDKILREAIKSGKIHGAVIEKEIVNKKDPKNKKTKSKKLENKTKKKKYKKAISNNVAQKILIKEIEKSLSWLEKIKYARKVQQDQLEEFLKNGKAALKRDEIINAKEIKKSCDEFFVKRGLNIKSVSSSMIIARHDFKYIECKRKTNFYTETSRYQGW